MKYTRYNVKPKKKPGNNLMFYVALTLLLALILGTFMQKIFLKEGSGIWFKDGSGQEENFKPSSDNLESSSGSSGKGKDTSNAEDDSKGGESGDVVGNQYNFYLMQCGVFKVKENADKLVEDLKAYGKPFLDTEGELTKIYFGVYTDETYEGVSELLKSKGIDTSKVTISVPIEDLSTGQLCKSLDNLIQIITKTYESGVKSIKTSDIKSWISNLDPIESSMKNYNGVEEVKVYINNLPEEVDKTSFEDGMKFIYDKIKEFKK